MSREGQRQCRVIRDHGPLQVYHSASGVIEVNDPVADTAWTMYYKTHRRNTLDATLAPWVIKRLEGEGPLLHLLGYGFLIVYGDYVDFSGFIKSKQDTAS